MDVMFLVLVFFIYSIFQMSVHRGIKVDLRSGAGAAERGERVVLTIRADDTLQLNGQDLPRAEVVARVRALQATGLKMPVIVSGDRKASLGVGIEILGELKAAGVEKASFQVSGESQ